MNESGGDLAFKTGSHASAVPDRVNKLPYETKDVKTPFDIAIEKGIDQATTLLLDRFGPLNKKSPEQFYHTLPHSQRVAEGAVAILNAMGATPREQQLARLVGYWHDVVQKAGEPQAGKEENYKGFFFQRRKLARKRGQNEIDSALELELFMKQHTAFTDDDIKVAKEAINLTFPDFKTVQTKEPYIPFPGAAPTTQSATAFQPSLTSESSNIAKAVCLADLGVPGMDGLPKGKVHAFISDGNNLFREEQLDIPDLLKEAGDSKTTPEKKDAIKEFIAMRIKEYYQGQMSFVAGREAYFNNHEINLFGEDKRPLLQALFSKFDSTKAVLAQYQAELESKTPDQIIAEVYEPSQVLPNFNEKKLSNFSSVTHLS
jgi:hypothetical protein